MDVIFLNFAKTFDKVPKKRLLTNWSRWLDVLFSVPQGSVLGLVLFLIFINNLHVQTKFTTILKKFTMIQS
jgi:hypothetical protein